ncbi:hypothetical protein DXA97_11245 [Clostridium sp. OF09-36]|nr:hypothetical protein DXA97_11245 [Clostridium sp. OF09-36]
MRWLKQCYTGYVKVRMTGGSPERFLNLCRGNGISLWNLTFEKEQYQFFLLLSDFFRIRPFVRKAGVRVRVQEKLGLPFFYTGTGNENCLQPASRAFFSFCL